MNEYTKETTLAIIGSIISLLDDGDQRIWELEELCEKVRRKRGMKPKRAMRELDRYTWAKFSGDPRMEQVLDARRGRLLAMH